MASFGMTMFLFIIYLLFISVLNLCGFVTCILMYSYIFSGLFWRIHQMEPMQSAVWFVVMTIVSTWLVAFAYKNVKFVLKHK